MLSNQPIRILVIDDHRMLFEGLKASLPMPSNITLVKLARNSEEALQYVKDGKTLDLIILDLVLDIDYSDGVRLIENFCNIGSKVPILIYSGYGLFGEELYKLLLNPVIAGYINKQEGIAMLHYAIEGIVRKNQRGWLSPSVVDDLLLYIRRKEYVTEIELKILQMLSIGQNSERIAITLDLSKSAIEKYIQKLFVKTGTNSRIELLAKARQNKWIDK